MTTDNKARIMVLKRKVRRNNLLKKLSSIVNVSDGSFLSDEENKIFCKKVFEKIQSTKNKIKIGGQDYRYNIELSKNHLKNFLNECTFENDFVCIFFYGEYEIEALRININEAQLNIIKILEISRFLDGYGDFVLVDCDLKYGIVIDRLEYYYEFSTWGF